MKTQILTDEQFNSLGNQNRDNAIIGYYSIKKLNKTMDKLAEEILIANKIQFERLKEEKPMLAYNIIEAMQAYHEAKIEEITDADIEEWAFRNYPDSYNMRKSCKAGAKAMREGEIKHIEK